MPNKQPPGEYQLPLTGNRNGHDKQLIGDTRVLDDQFTREVLAQMTWHLANGYREQGNCMRLPGI